MLKEACLPRSLTVPVFTCLPQGSGVAEVFGPVVHMHTFLHLVKLFYPGSFSSTQNPPGCLCVIQQQGLDWSLERAQALDFLDFICPSLLPVKVFF